MFLGMKNTSVVLLSFLCAVCLASCASVAHYEKIDSSVDRGDYSGALAQVKAQEGKGYRDKDMVLYYLDSGMLSHYSEDYSGSSQLLGKGERAIAAAFTKSVTQEVSTYLLNDTMQEYAGEDYEDIYLNVFNALNYYHRGMLDDAMVEIRRIDNKLKMLSTKYGVATTKAQKAVLDKNSGIPYDSKAMTASFTNSALARYLSMLFYRAEGRPDDARIDRDQIKLAFANQKSVYPFPLPKDLDAELSIPKGMARLNIIGFAGKSPVKTEDVVRIPLSATNWIKIAVPKMTPRPSMASRAEVVMDSGETFQLGLIEDMGAVAAETFKQKAGLIYLKTVLRATAKTSSSMILEEQSREADSAEGALILGLLSLGSQVLAETSEQADLRMSRYYPAKALVGGITLAPGIYSFTVNYYNVSKKLVHSVRFKDVNVKTGELNLLEAICIK